MPLTEKEKIGIRCILKKLSEYDTKCLAETITNHMVHLENVEEAQEAILTCAASAVDVLKRKKVRKDLIFQYLYETGARIVSPQADKPTIVRTALTLWDSTEVQDGRELIPMEEDMPYEDAQPGPEVGFLNNTANLASSSSNTNSEVHEMAIQFVRWFYPILNNGHVANANNEDNFGPHHFWQDCQLKVHTPQYEHLVEGSTAVAQKLLTLIGQHQLYFNPFDAQQGVRSVLEPHGMVAVLACGGLHRGDSCIGIYEQKFGLVRDPSAGNNWKIKFTEVKLNGKDLDMSPLDAPDDCYALEYS